MAQDYAEAMKWYRTASDQGNPDSQVLLANMYAKGEAVPQNYAEAAKWFRKAADKGSAGAQYMLASLYYGGLGVPRDFVQALMWFDLAAAQPEGVPLAPFISKANGILVPKMTPAQVEQAKALAAAWKPTTAQ